MELFIDLIPKRKKSNLTILIGAISLAFPIIYFVLRIQGERDNLFSQWPIMVFLFLNGVNGIVTGLGYSVEKFFGSAYVQVDDDVIVVKTKVIKKAQSFVWSKIKTLDYKTNWFEITDLDGLKSRLILSDLEFKVLAETRDTISAIAEARGKTRG